MKKITNILIFIILMVLISCESEEAIKQAKEEKQKLKDETEINHLAEKYKAIRVSKPLNFFTYRLQTTFIDNKKLICFEGEIKDISKTDSSFILKIYLGSLIQDTNYLALISVKSTKFSEIRKILHTKYHSKEGGFIFKVSKIDSFKPAIDNEEDYVFNFDSILLIFKGDLIDFYIKETNTKKTIHDTHDDYQGDEDYPY